MSNQKNNVVATEVITKREVIKSLAHELNMTIGSISSVYNSLENKIKLMLANADDDKNIELRLFDGVKLHSRVVPYRERFDTLTGKRKMYDRKIKVKANFTRTYLNKLNRKK